MLKLVKIHEDLPTEILDSIKDQCVKILNYEWPRNELLRYRTLNSSKESFPMCIALVKIPENVVIGHVKLSEIPSNRSAVYIESVVIHPDLRGQGIGKYLMLRTEKFCREKGYKIVYLCTIDMQVFYSRIGYKFCKPVVASSGTVSVGMKHGMFSDNSHKDFLNPDKKKNKDEDLLPIRTDELGEICSKVFQSDPKLPEIEPVIKLPLGDVTSCPTMKNNKLVTVHKDFMKKWLN